MLLFAVLSLFFTFPLAGASPSNVAPSAAEGVAVDFTFAGFDDLEEDVRGTVTATVQVTARGALGDHDPLRVLATLVGDDGPMADTDLEVLAADGTWADTTTDAQGRFFFPPPGHAPMSLATTPALLDPAGADQELAFTLPAGNYDLTAQLVLPTETSEDVWRIGGTDRIETAAMISAAYFDPGVDVVFVARHDSFPDALAGGPALGVLGAPLLLVTTDSIPAATAAELDRLDPGRIVILGGEAAVGAAVETALAPYTTGSVDRLSGDDRYETAAAIAVEFFEPGVATAYLATGTNWPDAVSGGAAAAFDDAPVLLVQPDAIPPATIAALQALQPQRIVVLGGTAAVSAEVEAALAAYTTGDVERYAGATRYETSAMISARTFGAPLPVAFLATGLSYPDVLTGVPAAALFGAPVLLIGDPIPDAIAAELERLRDGGQLDLVLFGGTAAISEAVEAALGVHTGTSVPDADVVTPLGVPHSIAFEIVPVGSAGGGGGGGVTPPTDPTTTTTTAPPIDYDHELTVQLHWQNEYRAEEGHFGGVDDYAAFHLDPEGTGTVTFGWDTDGTTVGITGDTELTSPPTGFTVHDGGLREEVEAALTLPIPSFDGDAADAPTAGDRGLYTYDLDATVNDAEELIELLEAKTGYVNIRTTNNGRGEVRAQLDAADGGLSGIVPIYQILDFHDFGVGTNTGEPQTSFNLVFDAKIDYPEATQDWPDPEDFVLTRERDGVTEVMEIIRVRGNNEDWQPYPKPDLRLHLDTHEVIKDGDIVTVTMLDSGAQKLLPYGRNAAAGDLMDSWRTHCTHVISVVAFTSEPCGTPQPQPGLSDPVLTPIQTAPDQDQTISITIEDEGLPADDGGAVDGINELWIDLLPVSEEGLVDYRAATWTATVDGVPVGTAEYYEYPEVEHDGTEYLPYLAWRHTESAPVDGRLVLTGTGIDGSDAADHGVDTTWDTHFVRLDTGRVAYAEIEVQYVAQPVLTLEPVDAVRLAEDGATQDMTATYTDTDGNPIVGAELRFWGERGEYPAVTTFEIGTATTDADGKATVTHTFPGGEVKVGEPMVVTVNVEDEAVDTSYVDAHTTVTWAAGVATNTRTTGTYHDLNQAVAAAEAGDTISAEGAFTSVYGTNKDDRISVSKAVTLQGHGTATLAGAIDVRASDASVDGFVVTWAGNKEYVVRVEGAGISITDNVIDAAGMNGINVRDAWSPLTGGGSATITGNEISNAAVGIHVDVDRMKAGEPVPFVLVTDLTVTGNTFTGNGTDLYWSPDPGSTVDISGNSFNATAVTNVHVDDATLLEDAEVALDDDVPLVLQPVLDGNTYDNGNPTGPPEAEILGTKIVPIDPEHVPSMVRVVEHGAGTGNMYSVVEYTRGVACDADGAAVGSQFVLNRGEEQTPNRFGVAVECGYEGDASLVKIEWDGNPSFPNEITYTAHADPQYRIHNEHALASGDFTEALSPQTIGSPFPKPADEAPVYGAVYLDLNDATMDGRWFSQGQSVYPVDLHVSIAERSEVPETGLALWFDGARPGEDFIAGETICAELLTAESCSAISTALAAGVGFTDNTDFLTDATLQVNSAATPGSWQLRFWVVDAATSEAYFSDTFSILILESPAG